MTGSARFTPRWVLYGPPRTQYRSVAVGTSRYLAASPIE